MYPKNIDVSQGTAAPDGGLPAARKQSQSGMGMHSNQLSVHGSECPCQIGGHCISQSPHLYIVQLIAHLLDEVQVLQRIRLCPAGRWVLSRSGPGEQRSSVSCRCSRALLPGWALAGCQTACGDYAVRTSHQLLRWGCLTHFHLESR